MSKKRTKTERYERQLAAINLLAQIGTIPPHVESKRIELSAKLELLYEGTAKRQMRGLITRELHDRPPMERHVIDRSVPVIVKESEPTNPAWVKKPHVNKSWQRLYNAIIRGQYNRKASQKYLQRGFGLGKKRMGSSASRPPHKWHTKTYFNFDPKHQRYKLQETED